MTGSGVAQEAAAGQREAIRIYWDAAGARREQDKSRFFLAEKRSHGREEEQTTQIDSEVNGAVTNSPTRESVGLNTSGGTYGFHSVTEGN